MTTDTEQYADNEDPEIYKVAEEIVDLPEDLYDSMVNLVGSVTRLVTNRDLATLNEAIQLAVVAAEHIHTEFDIDCTQLSSEAKTTSIMMIDSIVSLIRQIYSMPDPSDDAAIKSLSDTLDDLSMYVG